MDIPSQPLAEALAAYAKQTGLQLLYVSSIARGRVSKGAPAGLTRSAALTRLLEGTGMRFEALNERSVRILVDTNWRPPAGAPPRPAHAADRPPRGIAEITVTANAREEALAQVQNVPASVSIISGESLIAEKSENLLDYAAVIPGFSVFDSGYTGWRSVILRGIYSFTQASSVAYYLDEAPWARTDRMPVRAVRFSSSPPTTSNGWNYCAVRKARSTAKSR